MRADRRLTRRREVQLNFKEICLFVCLKTFFIIIFIYKWSWSCRFRRILIQKVHYRLGKMWSIVMDWLILCVTLEEDKKADPVIHEELLPNVIRSTTTDDMLVQVVQVQEDNGRNLECCFCYCCWKGKLRSGTSQNDNVRQLPKFSL